MTANSQTSIMQSQEFAESGVPSPDISHAKSVTFIIHGVGETTSQELLDVTGKGFVASSIGGSYERMRLEECPTLSGKNGAEAILIQNPHGDHYVVALPWTDREFRLAPIARFSIKMLLVATILVTLAVPFRSQVENFYAWLEPMSHRLIAYVVMWILGALKQGSDSKGEVQMPYGLLFWPLLLDIGLKAFIDVHFAILIPLAILVIVLLFIACISIARCVPLAPTASWRLSLVALIVRGRIPRARCGWTLAEPPGSCPS
jgi:hypothetical protein